MGVDSQALWSMLRFVREDGGTVKGEHTEPSLSDIMLPSKELEFPGIRPDETLNQLVNLLY